MGRPRSLILGLIFLRRGPNLVIIFKGPGFSKKYLRAHNTFFLKKRGPFSVMGSATHFSESETCTKHKSCEGLLKSNVAELTKHNRVWISRHVATNDGLELLTDPRYTAYPCQAHNQSVVKNLKLKTWGICKHRELASGKRKSVQCTRPSGHQQTLSRVTARAAVLIINH